MGGGESVRRNIRQCFRNYTRNGTFFNNAFSNNALLKLLKASVYISVFGQFSANNMQKRIKKYAGTLPLVMGSRQKRAFRICIWNKAAWGEFK